MPEQFKAARRVCRDRIHIAGRPEVVFPLLCPEREKEWIDGWDAQILHSTSGVAEHGCLFMTVTPAEGPSWWLMTRHAAPREAEYVRFIPGTAISTLSLVLHEDGQCTSIDVERVFVGLSEAGNHYVLERERLFQQELRRLERALDHFVRTGRMLVASA